MSNNDELEARLRSQMATERHVYQAPSELASRIRHAIRTATLPSHRSAVKLQLAAAGGIIVLVAVLSVGVARIKNGGQSSFVTYRIATYPRADAYLLARLDGVLHGQANPDGTACFWVGEGSERVALVWPYGSIARGNPLSVYDEHGARFGVVESHVTLGGGGGAPTDGSSVSVPGCAGPFSHRWAVSPISNTSPR